MKMGQKLKMLKKGNGTGKGGKGVGAPHGGVRRLFKKGRDNREQRTKVESDRDQGVRP